MKIRKIAAVAAAACLAVTSLAGCGSSTSTTTTTTTTSDTEADDAADTAAEGATYKIGICQLVQHAALDQATLGFKDALTELGEENGVTFEFDEQNAQGDANTCITIANQFASNEYDLMMANATAALQACANASDTIPVVGTSVTSFASALDIELDENECTGINVTGTNDLTPLALQAQQVVDLFPDANQVGILYCSAEVNSVYQAEHIAESFDELGMAYEFYSFADSNELQSICQKAATESDVIFIPTDNTAASNTGNIDQVCEQENTPVVAGEEGICEGCGIATISISFYDIGYRAGEMAYDILVNGADPATMTVESPQTLTYEYNPVIAERFGMEFPEDYVAMEIEAETEEE